MSCYYTKEETRNPDLCVETLICASETLYRLLPAKWSVKSLATPRLVGFVVCLPHLKAQSLLKMAEPTKKVSESGDEVSNVSDSATSASSSCGDDLGE